MDAADTLFYERGFRAVGIDEIIATSSVAKTTLYHHFRSKDLLIAACLEQRSTDAQALFEQEVRKPELTPAEQIDRFFEIIEIWCSDPTFRGCPFINFGIEFPLGIHPARGVCLSHRLWMSAFLGGIAAQGGADAPVRLGSALRQLYDAAMVGSQIEPGGGDATLARSTARTLVATIGANGSA